MPPRRTQVSEPEPEPAAPPPSTALALPDDVRADLLRAQANSIQTAQRLPRVKIMPAAAGLFEFMDTNDTERTFDGVVLNNHPRNVLWEVPYGTARPSNADGSPQRPGCVSPDGLKGTPREGFTHAALNGGVATGVEEIPCRSCPYNQWGSKHLVDSRGGKGKACTNQRSVYVMMQDRATPVELILPPTSLTPFDEYLTNLLNRGVPVQAVVTKFGQERKQRGQVEWCQTTYTRGVDLNQEQFDLVLAKRQQWMSSITPASVQQMVEEAEQETRTATPTTAGAAAEAAEADVEDERLPF